MAKRETILKDALALPADEHDREVEALWIKEANARLDAYDRGELKAIPIDDVLARL